MKLNVRVVRASLVIHLLQIFFHACNLIWGLICFGWLIHINHCHWLILCNLFTSYNSTIVSLDLTSILNLYDPYLLLQSTKNQWLSPWPMILLLFLVFLGGKQILWLNLVISFWACLLSSLYRSVFGIYLLLLDPWTTSIVATISGKAVKATDK